MFLRQICLLVFSFLWVNSLTGQARQILQQYPLESPQLRNEVLSHSQEILNACREILELDTEELSPRERVGVMSLAAYTYSQIGLADSARKMLKWTERQDADQYAYPEKMISCIAKGNLLIRSYQCIEAYKTLHKAQEIAMANLDLYQVHNINTMKGLSLYLRGVEEEAFTLINDGIREMKKEGFNREALEAENNLAALLIRSGYYDEAIDVLDRASHSSGSGLSPDFATYLWLNKAMAKFKNKSHDIDLVLQEIDIGISLAKERDFTIGILFGCTLKGEVLASQGRWLEAEKALAHYGDPSYQEIFNSQSDLYSYSSLIFGAVQEHLQNWEEAKAAYNWAIGHTVPGSRFPDYEMGFQGLHRIALATGDRENAAQVFDQLSHLKDSLFQEKNKANYELIEARREITQKDQRIIEAEQKLEIQALSRRLLIGGMVLIVLISLILSLIYRNRTIQQDKEKTDTVNRQLESYTNELEELAFVVSHNLRESARNISTFTGLFSRNNEAQLTGKGKQYLQHMQSASLRTSDMLSDLETYVGIGKNLFDPSPISLDQVIEGVVSQAPFNSLDEQIHIGPLPVVLAHVSMMKLLFHQLLDNSFKFRKAEEALSIRIHHEQRPDSLLIHVEDNGIGFAPEYSDKIFRVFQRLHATEEISGTGIGLAIADKIVRYYGGEISADSVPGNGSRFTIHFPSGMLSSER